MQEAGARGRQVGARQLGPSLPHIVALGRQCGLNILTRMKYVGVFQEALLFLHRLSESVFMKTHAWCVSSLKSSRGGCAPAL